MLTLRAIAPLALAFALCAALPGAAFAGPQFVDEDGVANFGYDVVAYHTDFAAVKGSNAFTADYNGAPFWFATAENRDLFLADPERFALAYDGHCAWAVSLHKKLTVDPAAFSIIDPLTGAQVDRESYSLDAPGVVYLNYDPKTNAKFNEALPDILKESDFAWTDCLETLPAARPKKSFRDLFGGKRPDFCPKA